MLRLADASEQNNCRILYLTLFDSSPSDLIIFSLYLERRNRPESFEVQKTLANYERLANGMLKLIVSTELTKI